MARSKIPAIVPPMRPAVEFPPPSILMLPEVRLMLLVVLVMVVGLTVDTPVVPAIGKPISYQSHEIYKQV